MLAEHAEVLAPLLSGDKFPPDSAAHTAILAAVSAMTAAAREIDMAPTSTVDMELPMPART
jgi:hypothetical protein